MAAFLPKRNLVVIGTAAEFFGLSLLGLPPPGASR